MANMKIVRTMEGEEQRDADGNVISASIKYYVFNPSSKGEAMDGCWGDAPDLYGGSGNQNAEPADDDPNVIHLTEDYNENDDSELEYLPKSGVRFDGIEQGGTFVISVLYEKEDGQDSRYGSSSTDYLANYTFDCSSGSRHITTSLGQTIIDGKIDPKGAIGWNGKTGSESQVAGVDISDANITESYTRVIASSKVDNLKQSIASMVNCVNSKSFNGWKAGEVLFIGASFSRSFSKKISEDTDKKSKLTAVTYHFAIRFNEDVIKIGDKTYGKNKKKGFQYLWTIAENSPDSESPKMVIKGVFLENVFREADLNGLKIPGLKKPPKSE